MRPAAESRGVSIERDFERASMPTSGDPDRLQQVIWNLLSNAVKFTPSGGRVSIAARRLAQLDEIVVSDTGIGIDPAFLPNVFETFRQADASTTRAHGGLGPGRSIVKQLVALHGGEVIAASEGTGRGASFTVRLPVRAARRDEAAVAPGGLQRRLAGYDFVVVDDDLDTRELLVSALEGAAGRVRSAASTRKALAPIRQRTPDAVISDIGMPGEDGYAFMRALTEELGERSPRVRIALSAFAAPGDGEQALAAGFQRHVAKPVDPHALIRLLEEMLGKRARAVAP